MEGNGSYSVIGCAFGLGAACNHRESASHAKTVRNWARFRSALTPGRRRHRDRPPARRPNPDWDKIHGSTTDRPAPKPRRLTRRFDPADAQIAGIPGARVNNRKPEQYPPTPTPNRNETPRFPPGFATNPRGAGLKVKSQVRPNFTRISSQSGRFRNLRLKIAATPQNGRSGDLKTKTTRVNHRPILAQSTPIQWITARS